MKEFELTEYMNAGIRNLVSDAVRSADRNPRQTAFLLRFALSCRRAGHRRGRYEKSGVHIPAFLIASIAADCNLFCTGCYARANRLCDKTAGCGARNEGELSPSGEAARETLT
ncbi:MAG: hypothetical protein PHU80_10320, partial [Kiritimatiellae bacterium]|nr:hypothetical protein [Kiritimatiellia bacterium]